MTKAMDFNFEKALQYEKVIRTAVRFVLTNYNRKTDNTIDDLSQEIIIKVAESLHSFKEETAKIETWITSIARNYTVSFLRKKQNDPKNYVDSSFFAFIEDSSSPEKEILRKEKYESVMNAIYKLTNNQKKALSLFLNGHSYIDIASIMELSLSSVKSLIFRAREFLKKELIELVA